MSLINLSIGLMINKMLIMVVSPFNYCLRIGFSLSGLYAKTRQPSHIPDAIATFQ